MKLFTVLGLLIIVLALFWGLFGLLCPAPGGQRAVRALTVRIGPSVLLFVLLCVGMFMVWWMPHSL